MRTILIALLMTFATQAGATIITNYEQWKTLNNDQKHGYVAGVIDHIHFAAFTLGNTSGKISDEQKLFTDCIREDVGDTADMIKLIEVLYDKVDIDWVTPSALLFFGIAEKCGLDGKSIKLFE